MPAEDNKSGKQGIEPQDKQRVELTIKQDELKSAVTKRIAKVEANKLLVVRLEFKATGYRWSLSKYDEKNLVMKGDPKTERTENKPGAAEYKVYRFQIKGSGSATFSLARPFEKEKQPKRLIVTAQVGNRDEGRPSADRDKR